MNSCIFLHAKFLSSIKKYKKSNAISFESVPLDIKIDVFSVKKEHTFPGFPHVHCPVNDFPNLDNSIVDSLSLPMKRIEVRN